MASRPYKLSELKRPDWISKTTWRQAVTAVGPDTVIGEVHTVREWDGTIRLLPELDEAAVEAFQWALRKALGIETDGFERDPDSWKSGAEADPNAWKK